jgi:hypothetical protein
MDANMQPCFSPYLTTPYFDTGSVAGACMGLIPVFLGPIAAVLGSIPVVLGSIPTTVLRIWYSFQKWRKARRTEREMKVMRGKCCHFFVENFWELLIILSCCQKKRVSELIR